VKCEGRCLIADEVKKNNTKNKKGGKKNKETNKRLLSQTHLFPFVFLCFMQMGNESTHKHNLLI